MEGNRIGVDATENAAALPNAEGLRLRDGARRSTIGGSDSGTDGNHIAFNAGAGVVVEFTAGAGNAILSNSIHDNGGLGIDFGGDGVTPNHGSEAGSRGSVNFPVLTKVTPYSVEGTLDAAPHTSYTLQFFSNETCDPSGYGQGETQIATWNVTTDAGGHADFGVSLTAARGQGVAATATSVAAGTSEFSPCVLPEVEEGPANLTLTPERTPAHAYALPAKGMLAPAAARVGETAPKSRERRPRSGGAERGASVRGRHPSHRHFGASIHHHR